MGFLGLILSLYLTQSTKEIRLQRTRDHCHHNWKILYFSDKAIFLSQNKNSIDHSNQPFRSFIHDYMDFSVDTHRAMCI